MAIAALALALTTAAPERAFAAADQVSIIEPAVQASADSAATLLTVRALGSEMVRVIVNWAQIAPDPRSRTPPRGFDAADPADYPAANWAPYDRLVELAKADGIALDFTLTGGAPRWAEGAGIPHQALDNQFYAWRPSAADFGQFVRAVGERYSGSYTSSGRSSPLPRVSFWSIWNEPNFGQDLAPQAIDGSTVSVAPEMYRNLVDQAWSALAATGHTTSTDTILIGETAPQGLSGPASPSHPQGLPGDFSQTKPLVFVRTLYCVSSSYQELRGAAAKAVGCPATATASRRFAAENPALFGASAFAVHPYSQYQPPDEPTSADPNYATFARLPNLEQELDRLQRVYRSPTRFPIYDTEYGYITHPPSRGHYPSPATAAYYLNWAEYLSWKSPRIASTTQYLLNDPLPNPATPDYGGFATGLSFHDGTHKPAYAAYRLPLYLPATSVARGRALRVWGCVRPAHYAILDTGQPQTARLQFRRGARGSFATLQSVTIAHADDCYFDVPVKFPASGTLRLAYTYPASDPLLPAGSTVYSRSVAVTVR